jgi:surface antigen
VRRIAIGPALIAALATLSACGTLGGTGRDNGGVKPPQADTTDTAVIMKSMRGGLIGGSVGAGLGDDEKQRALEAEYRALEYSQVGQPVPWKGDESTTFGEVKAAQAYRVGSQDCRQYTQTVNRSGQSRVARGTACRNPDGSWTPLT